MSEQPSIKVTRGVKLPGEVQFKMHSIEYTSVEPRDPSMSLLEQTRRLEKVLDEKAAEWEKQHDVHRKQESDRSPEKPPSQYPAQPDLNSRVPAQMKEPLKPDVSKPQPPKILDAFPDVKWQQGPYGEFTFTRDPAVKMLVVAMTDNQGKVGDVQIGSLKVRMTGKGCVAGGHYYKINGDFLNRQVASKPQE